MASLLLSDLHLPATASPLREAFVAFLEGPARTAQEVYILGDLFEVWIGDDIGLQIYAREVSRLSALTALGVPVYLMHGNRDFMIGKSFAQITGVQMLHDPLVVDLQGTPTLLSHGDLWCTDDLSYQRWRRFSRLALVQWAFLQLPRPRREKIASGLRSQSDEQKPHKTAEIMDVNPAAIASAFEQYGVQRMIHGHTHRPATHRDGRGRERIVLADWRPQRMEYQRADQSGLHSVWL